MCLYVSATLIAYMNEGSTSILPLLIIRMNFWIILDIDVFSYSDGIYKIYGSGNYCKERISKRFDDNSHNGKIGEMHIVDGTVQLLNDFLFIN